MGREPCIPIFLLNTFGVTRSVNITFLKRLVRAIRILLEQRVVGKKEEKYDPSRRLLPPRAHRAPPLLPSPSPDGARPARAERWQALGEQARVREDVKRSPS